MTDTTDRLALPLLAAGQAQKEMTHNEALTRLSMATQASVVAVAPASVPASPLPGQCWIVGAAPGGAWSGKAHHLACWTVNGWRFIAPFDGMAVWSVADTQRARYAAGGWSIGVVTGSAIKVAGTQVVGAQAAAIASPASGSTVDAEARSALAAILAALRGHGLIAT